MNDIFLANLLDEQLNGVIVLNTKKEVIYSNKLIRQNFKSQINTLLGDYLKCNYTILEQVNCQQTTNCKSCVVNNVLDSVLRSNKSQIVYDIDFNSNGNKLVFSIKVTHKNDTLILEMFDFQIDNKKLHLLSRLVEKSKDVMFFKDSKLRYRYINQSGANLFKKSKDDILGKTDYELMDINSYRIFLDSDLKTLKEGTYSCIESANDMHFLISKENIDSGILCIIRDITKELIATKKAEIDSLTNLYNRRKFMDIIDEIYMYNKQNFYLALIDLDDLRYINNSHGHSKGDKYLSIVGEILNTHSKGLFFRLGGDEFAGLIQGEKLTVELLFSNIFKDIKELKLNPKLSLSVGIIKINTDKSYLYNYEEADKILYSAKKDGKNKFIVSH